MVSKLFNTGVAQGNSQRVLVVDDDPGVAILLQTILNGAGYVTSRAVDGLEALASVTENPPDLIFLDLDMPRLDGFDVCQKLKNDPDTRLIPIIVLTGNNEPDSRLRAWELGADEFLSKPFTPLEGLTRCRSLLRLKQVTDKLDAATSVVVALGRAVEAKNPYTLGHAERVTALTLELAARIGLDDKEKETLSLGGLLHDIGKLAIPDAILNKPGPLTAEEYEVVKQHPLEGVRIVQPLRSLQETIPLIRWHHERLDGRGYPDGLAAKDISLPVRIISVADVYDALMSARPYRPALPVSDCLALLRANASGGGLDTDLVKLFAEIVAG